MLQQSWKEVTPRDRYAVLYQGKLSHLDHKVIQFLYQPLIGVYPVALYLSLLQEVTGEAMWSKTSTHYWLMNVLNLNMGDIFEARKKLEGVGLLKTWKKPEEEGSTFIYEILLPLSPEQYFNSDMLPVYLQQKLGDRHFERILQLFGDRKIPNDFQDVTTQFNDVFMTSQQNPQAFANNEANISDWKEDHQFFSKTEQSSQQSIIDQFDFDLLFSTVKKSFVPQQSFSPQVKETIAMLSYLYDINALEMANLILRCLNERDEIELVLLRKFAKETYAIEHYGKLPTLAERIQPEYVKTIQEPKTAEERLLYTFENTSPLDMLIGLSNGAKPSSADLSIIEGVMLNQKLPPGVVNVLLHYVMLKSNMKLQAKYVEKIAAHWARMRIQTVTDAYKLALSEEAQYKKWAEENKTKTSRGRTPIRKEIVPDWMNKSENEIQQPMSADLQAEVEQLKKELDQFNKGGE